MKPKLKPCPFCGAEYVKYNDNDKIFHTTHKNGCYLIGRNLLWPSRVKRWNKRAK